MKYYQIDGRSFLSGIAYALYFNKIEFVVNICTERGLRYFLQIKNGKTEILMSVKDIVKKQAVGIFLKEASDFGEVERRIIARGWAKYGDRTFSKEYLISNKSAVDDIITLVSVIK